MTFEYFLTSLSVPTKHVPVHLENMICWLGHLCSSTMLHLLWYAVTYFYLYQRIVVTVIWILHLALVHLINCLALVQVCGVEFCHNSVTTKMCWIIIICVFKWILWSFYIFSDSYCNLKNFIVLQPCKYIMCFFVSGTKCIKRFQCNMDTFWRQH